MRKRNIAFELEIYESKEELHDEAHELMLKAVEARKNAYAPYSNFQVGAALLLENGVSVIGNNQENACYPVGLCAERVAIFQAGAKYPGMAIKSIAISATSMNHIVATPAAPCGSCRQAISEYELRQKQSIQIFMMGEIGEVLKCNSVGDILPLAFTNSFL
jgi:cytidine deaminase